MSVDQIEDPEDEVEDPEDASSSCRFARLSLDRRLGEVQGERNRAVCRQALDQSRLIGWSCIRSCSQTAVGGSSALQCEAFGRVNITNEHSK